MGWPCSHVLKLSSLESDQVLSSTCAFRQVCKDLAKVADLESKTDAGETPLALSAGKCKGMPCTMLTLSALGQWLPTPVCPVFRQGFCSREYLQGNGSEAW